MHVRSHPPTVRARPRADRVASGPGRRWSRSSWPSRCWSRPRRPPRRTRTHRPRSSSRNSTPSRVRPARSGPTLGEHVRASSRGRGTAGGHRRPARRRPRASARRRGAARPRRGRARGGRGRARRAVEATEAEEAELARTEAELAAEEGALAEQAVAAYKFGSAGARAGLDGLRDAAPAQDPNELAVGMQPIGQVIDGQGDDRRPGRRLRDANAIASRRGRARAQPAAQAAADAAAQVRFTDESPRPRPRRSGRARARRRPRQAGPHRPAARRRRPDRAAASQRVAARQAELTARAGRPPRRRGGAPPRGRGACRRRGRRSRRDRPVRVDAVVRRLGRSRRWTVGRRGVPGGRRRRRPGLLQRLGLPPLRRSDPPGQRRLRRPRHPRSSPSPTRWWCASTATDSGLGGLTVTYRTADGSEWYNAHLETLAPGHRARRERLPGATVGTVGDSGNARGTPPHNHIGRRHGGGWVNPWPTISAALPLSGRSSRPVTGRPVTARRRGPAHVAAARPGGGAAAA